MRPPTISPTKPTGRNFSIAGYAMSWPSSAGSRFGKRLLDVRQLRVDDDRAEADEDPRPRAAARSARVEEEHGAERVPLRFRREHALRDVAAAAGLGAGIPHRPPLHRDRHDEHRDRDVPVVREVGQDVQVVDAVRARAAARAATPCRCRPPTPGACSAKYAAAITAVILMKNCTMSMTSTPQRPECAANDDVQDADERAASASAGGRRGSPAILQAARLTVAMIMQLNRKPEIDGAEPADEPRGRARVADLVELEVGHHARPAPQPRVEEHRRDRPSAGTPTTPSSRRRRCAGRCR